MLRHIHLSVKCIVCICLLVALASLIQHSADAKESSKLNIELGSTSDKVRKWGMLSPNIGHRTGKAQGDDWIAIPPEDKPGFLVFGPYVDDLDIGEWTATWSMKVSSSINASSKIARLEVYDPDSDEVLAFQELTGYQFSKSHGYQDFYLKFMKTKPKQRLELRVFWYGETTLQVNHVAVHQAAKLDFIKSWKMSDPALGHRIGRADGEGWSANMQQDKEGFLSFGPYVKNLPLGAWKVSFPLIIDNNSADNAKIVRLEVYDPDADEILSSREVTRQQFLYSNVTQYFEIPFDNISTDCRLEFRIYWYGVAKVTAKDISIGKSTNIVYKKTWSLSEPVIGHGTGRLDEEGWSANTQQDSEGFLTFGPYVKDVPVGTWEINWPLMIDNHSADNAKVVRLEVFDVDADEILSFREIGRQEFERPYEYKSFNLRFVQVNPSHRLEFRTYWYGNAFIKMRNLQMKGTYPSSFGKVWNMSDPAMGHRTGKLIENAWVVEPQQDQSGYMSFGSYEKGMEIGTWISTWSMKLKNSSDSKDPVVRLDIYDADTGEIIQQKDVYQEQFIINHFQDLNVQFRNEHPGHALEFRVYWYGKHPVELKSIKVNKTRVLDEYVYDKNGRLMQWIGANGRNKYYRYDKNGNILRVIDME